MHFYSILLHASTSMNDHSIQWNLRNYEERQWEKKTLNYHLFAHKTALGDNMRAISSILRSLFALLR